ncbi:TetR/AcrR family transcriptional regulator [Geobacter sp. DSM 9736]|uniref:TetR/AcrR family transcriptional regulator n=1 Tax=Geobacter sp. DSM 9736 TaxID=1277350 RepID=UPI000B4FF279|nr:TetR/AcrR family transcriptional regulator [Geobacter sp. DSM 9736]SNB46872.1 transcriptional regulator, TetR family [Geobacter sp. DSM 9736]
MPETTANTYPARERLLAASLDLFTAKGYAGTSVREIVAAAGVTKPVLYYYFGSKEGIYLELMQDTYSIFLQIVSELSAAPGSARERIIRFATGIFDAFVERIQVVRLIYSIFYGPPQGTPPFPHEKYYDTMLETVAGFIRKGVEAGELKTVSIHSATWAVISCMNTVMEEQLCQTPPRIDRQGLIDVLGLILDGLSDGGRR